MGKETISRRQFISNSALIGAAGAVGGVTGTSGLLTSCASEGGKGRRFTIPPSDIPVVIPEMGNKAIDGKPLRAAIIGCGSRGSGTTTQFLTAADDVTITAEVCSTKNGDTCSATSTNNVKRD